MRLKIGPIYKKTLRSCHLLICIFFFLIYQDNTYISMIHRDCQKISFNFENLEMQLNVFVAHPFSVSAYPIQGCEVSGAYNNLNDNKMIIINSTVNVN